MNNIVTLHDLSPSQVEQIGAKVLMTQGVDYTDEVNAGMVVSLPQRPQDDIPEYLTQESLKIPINGQSPTFPNAG